MEELNYSLFIDESGTSSNKISFKSELSERHFFALASLKAQKKDIDEFYDKYLKQYEINEEIKYKDLKHNKSVMHKILNEIEEADFEINIEFVESQLYYLTLFCDYVYYPWWLFDEEAVELRQSFFHSYTNNFDETFFDLLDKLFCSKDIKEYEAVYNKLVPFLVEKQIMSEEELIRNLKETKKEISNGNISFINIKPLSNQYNAHTEIIVLPHLQCLYNLVAKGNDVKSIIHDTNEHYQRIFGTEITNYFDKKIKFKDSKSESGLKVIDIIVSYCKNTIEHMIKTNDYQEIDYVNLFFNNINFIINQKSQDRLFSESEKALSGFLKLLKNFAHSR